MDGGEGGQREGAGVEKNPDCNWNSCKHGQEFIPFGWPHSQKSLVEMMFISYSYFLSFSVPDCITCNFIISVFQFTYSHFRLGSSLTWQRQIPIISGRKYFHSDFNNHKITYNVNSYIHTHTHRNHQITNKGSYHEQDSKGGKNVELDLQTAIFREGIQNDYM